MNTLKPVRLAELKTQAALLLKELRKGSFNAAQRFLQLPHFQNKDPEWLMLHPDTIRLKHAYQVIAATYGYPGWNALRQAVIQNDCLYRPCCVAYVHAWFSGYEQAAAYQAQHGGYLLRFWKDHIVCGKEYITCIGMDPFEEQWQLTGYDWVKPKDKTAHAFLLQQATKNYISQ